MGYYLNPGLAARAAEHCRKVGKASSAGNLIRLLNALHACASSGLVLVSQAYVAAHLEMSVEFVKKGERALVAAGLIRRADKAGRRRILELVEPVELELAGEDRNDAPNRCGKRVERSCTTPAPEADRGTAGPSIGVQPYPYPAVASLVRARVPDEGVKNRDAGAREARSTLHSAVLRYAQAVRADAKTAQRLAQLAFDLQGLLGERQACDALLELEPWVLKVARMNTQGLAVSALAARVRKAQNRDPSQLRMFP